MPISTLLFSSKRKVLFLFASVFSYHTAQAQLDTNPPDVSWRQINTEKFQVIFPEGFENQAQHVANTLQYLHAPLSRSLQKEPRRLPLILQNRNAISNGFVTLAPRRSEFYTMPPQDYTLLGTNRWLDLLAVHEFRHVVQYDKARQSLSKLMYYLGGEYGLSVANNISIPNWFWEGDAVSTETAFTRSGRGRTPDFDLLYRTNLLSSRNYSYNKQHLGSFKDPVPNHYVLGYHLVTYGRRHYGADFWSGVIDQAASRFFVPFVFSSSLRYESGYSLPANYRRLQHELDSLWTGQVNQIELTEATTITKRSDSVYTNYEFPQELPDGSIVALKSGLGDYPQFVQVKLDGTEEKLFTPGPLNGNAMLSVAQNKIVWSEYEFDPRWQVRTYSVLKTYDLATGKKQVLQRKTRLAAPAFSPDASKIAAIEATLKNEYALVILDAITGKELKRIPAPQNDFLSMPRWSPDGKNIVLLRTANGQRTIQLLDPESNTFTEVLPPTTENIGHPVMVGNYVYFNAPYTGIENVFALDITTRQQYQVTSRPFAGTNATISHDGQQIIFNDFTKNGYIVARMPHNPATWVPLAQVPDTRVKYYQPVVEQEGNPDILTQVPNQVYPVQPYSKFKNIVKPHSWAPGRDPVNNIYTATLYSQDLLSTTVATATYSYNANEKTSRGQVGLSYQGFYPIINVAGAIGQRAEVKDDSLEYGWREKSITAGFQIPLNLTHSRYQESLVFGADANVTDVSDYERPRTALTEQSNGTLRNLHYNVAYIRSHSRSKRDLAGRFEQRLAINYYHTPMGGDYKSGLFAATAQFAFPGLFKHHSFQIGGNYQHQDVENYRFASTIIFPRGYSYRSHQNFAGGFVQYRLPLWYPDLALGPFLYFQRLRGNVFFDYGQGRSKAVIYQPNRNYQSIGAELSTDFNVMRFNGILWNFGVRFSYLPQEKDLQVEVLVVDVGF
ncbi:PD40 domain-containing protein [Adhaeribacter swui]|uniref:PD40 domain-containing protein n=1 Tax=Adhaeribacter swui TaxID=2086471 RepID=A0A7G7G663_9BACT|nr:PD40 domain-containing protein [Adhaeribacter swui]QNF32647.1 PD40 domain-containing protein [Adhaeribacter swui]